MRHWTQRWTLWSWCHRCGRTIWTVPWRNAYCSDFDRCTLDEWGLWLSSEWGEDFEPAPLLFEQPPADIADCSRCRGRGEVLRKDWESGPVPVECPRCHTTGVDPSLCPA